MNTTAAALAALLAALRSAARARQADYVLVNGPAGGTP